MCALSLPPPIAVDAPGLLFSALQEGQALPRVVLEGLSQDGVVWSSSKGQLATVDGGHFLGNGLLGCGLGLEPAEEDGVPAVLAANGEAFAVFVGG